MSSSSDRQEPFEPPRATGEAAALPYDPDASGGAHESAAADTSITAVRARHQARLLAIPGVVGVGVGQSETGDDAIVVYLRDAVAKRGLPTILEGHPVVTVVTGEIDAYRAKGPRIR
jgi:hypothetical protein